MNTETVQEKSCKNCCYYLEHYVKLDTSYLNIHSGHCRNIYNKDRHKKRELILCEYWEHISVKKEIRKNSIKETIEFMCNRLNEIAMLLEDDKSN